MQKYDLAIIGAGPGGYVAALRAAQFGLKVVCIDKRETIGGTCLNVGCIPSKALLQSTELYAHLKAEGKNLGIFFSDLKVDYEQMMARKEKVVHSLIHGIATLFKKQKVTFLQGTAHFIDAHHLLIKGREVEDTIEATSIIIATGSEPIELPFLPFDQKKIISSTEALSLKNLPEKLAVVGGGVIGVELASVFSRLGTKVTVIEMLPEICPGMDKAISKQLLQLLKNQGIEFFLSSRLKGGKINQEGVALELAEEKESRVVQADLALVAIGRKPNAEQLQLKNIGIELDEKGFIPVDGCFRTQQPHIFAIGDIIKGALLAHRASQEAMAVVDFLTKNYSTIDYISIPNVVYTSPEAASVGITEQEALALPLETLVGISYFKGNPRARCAGETAGLVKIIAEKKSKKVVGVHILGPHASEMIATGVILLQKRMCLKEVIETVFAHPTLSESIKEAALAAIGQPLHA